MRKQDLNSLLFRVFIQHYRGLKIEKKELALIYYEIAVSANWDGRFGEFKKIASLDYMNFLRTVSSDKSFQLNAFAKDKIKTLIDTITPLYKAAFGKEITPIEVAIENGTSAII